jgi:hypothetical protein
VYFFGHNYGCRWIYNTSFWPAFQDGCTRRVLREFLILSGKRRIYHSATNATITQNSRKIRGYTYEARARGSTSWAVVCRAPSASSGGILLLLLLLRHKNISEKQRKQVNSHLSLRSHTLAFSQPSRSPVPTSPHDTRLVPSPSSTAPSSAASCFRGRDLVHHQQGSVSIEQQARARCLPQTGRGLPTVAIVLTGSSPQ